MRRQKQKQQKIPSSWFSPPFSRWIQGRVGEGKRRAKDTVPLGRYKTAAVTLTSKIRIMTKNQNQPRGVPYFAMYNAHPTILAQTFRGKKSFVLIQLLIYLYLDTRFCIIKEFQHSFLNILWYKKFYVTNHYKTQEQIRGISGTTPV